MCAPAASLGSSQTILGSRLRPLIVGLTGSIGSGKSSVARLLAQRGALVIDADDLARQATDDPGVLTRIGEELGAHLVEGGRLDRQAVAAAVFADPDARARLNAIVHPWVGLRRLELQAEALASAEPPPMIVHDVPLLFEVGLNEGVDVTVVVTAPLPLRAARVAARSGLSEEQVRARDASQMPQEDKAARADFVVPNAAGLPELARQVDLLWPQLLARRRE
ncbi:MAG: dephospho-CoA kinase [Trueperaceae bacterium]